MSYRRGSTDFQIFPNLGVQSVLSGSESNCRAAKSLEKSSYAARIVSHRANGYDSAVELEPYAPGGRRLPVQPQDMVVFFCGGPEPIRLATFAGGGGARVAGSDQFFPRSGAGFTVALYALTMANPVHAWMRALAGSVARICRRVPTPAFWRGEGCLIDSAHGGLATYYGTPARVREELTQCDFRQEALLGNEHPKGSHEFLTDWYYYVFTKVENAAGESCE